MAADPQLAKCPCANCGTHLEFPQEMAGSSIACPNCNTETLLVLPETVAPPELETVAFPTLLSAFQGSVRGQRGSFFYQVGLLLVASAILILPVLYLAMVAGAGYGVYWWATHFLFLLKGPTYGVYFMVLKFFLYITPLLTGCIIVFFLIKPLLANRPKGAQPLALHPAYQPLFFAFVAEICRTIGSPAPVRIDVDCNLNASASFRRGYKSFFSDDLVLTLGLPLIAGLNVTELASVIAHEFGHFTQSFAMRLYYVISRVNGWFARVIYERDEWDVMLAEAAEEDEDLRFQLLVGIAMMGVGFSRLLLRPLMWIGIAISAFVSRQMEYNADAYEVEFAGTAVFERTLIRLSTLDAALDPAYKQMRVTFNNSRALPDDFPKFVAQHHARMPEEKRTAIADRVGLAKSFWYSTHPASGDRIRCARLMQKDGVFSLDAPATELFANFPVLSHQVSLLHYTDDLDLPLPLIQLRPTQAFFESKAPEPEPPNHAREELEKAFGPARLRLKSSAS